MGRYLLSLLFALVSIWISYISQKKCPSYKIKSFGHVYALRKSLKEAIITKVWMKNDSYYADTVIVETGELIQLKIDKALMDKIPDAKSVEEGKPLATVLVYEIQSDDETKSIVYELAPEEIRFKYQIEDKSTNILENSKANEKRKEIKKFLQLRIIVFTVALSLCFSSPFVSILASSTGLLISALFATPLYYTNPQKNAIITKEQQEETSAKEPKKENLEKPTDFNELTENEQRLWNANNNIRRNVQKSREETAYVEEAQEPKASDLEQQVVEIEQQNNPEEEFYTKEELSADKQNENSSSPTKQVPSQEEFDSSEFDLLDVDEQSAQEDNLSDLVGADEHIGENPYDDIEDGALEFTPPDDSESQEMEFSPNEDAHEESSIVDNVEDEELIPDSNQPQEKALELNETKNAQDVIELDEDIQIEILNPSDAVDKIPPTATPIENESVQSIAQEEIEVASEDDIEIEPTTQWEQVDTPQPERLKKPKKKSRIPGRSSGGKKRKESVTTLIYAEYIDADEGT